MKDRTPKHPGRVKLEPVAGQTNIFDMTRADEPDDTGTPFNTRTMLQDSTGRFLKLPYANPFVDDALRHMPDRIEPIGTVKTSPALSLGDAWLPCDGSQVTFAEYPALCNLLRGTSSVEFDAVTLGVTGMNKPASDIVYFDGKWYVAVCLSSVGSGTNYYTYPIKILSADTITGPWSVDFTINKNAYSNPPRLHMACTEDICVVALRYTEKTDATEQIGILYRKAGAATWEFTVLTDYISSTALCGMDVHDGVFAIAYGTRSYSSSGQTLIYSSTPDVPSSWQKVNGLGGTYTSEYSASLSYANGYWFYVYAPPYSNGSGELAVSYASEASGFQFKATTVTNTGVSKGVNSVSKMVAYNNRFYILMDGYVSSVLSSNNTVLVSTADFESWEHQIIQTNKYVDDSSDQYLCAICSNEKIMVMATAWGAWSTSDPTAQVTKVALPAGFLPTRARFNENEAIINSASSVAYHDFSTDTRLLPIISLSDDTTTYIKAKNELDVFEAGGG